MAYLPPLKDDFVLVSNIEEVGAAMQLTQEEDSTLLYNKWVNLAGHPNIDVFGFKELEITLFQTRVSKTCIVYCFHDVLYYVEKLHHLCIGDWGMHCCITYESTCSMPTCNFHMGSSSKIPNKVITASNKCAKKQRIPNFHSAIIITRSHK